MAKRLVRAKQKITHAGIPYRVPPASALPERTAGVLAVLYLLFNEGYSASSGAELVRKSLCDDAVMLAEVLAELMPEEPEVKGLLALMMFQRSRQSARVDSEGDLVTLDAQDRTLWDQAAIEKAKQILDDASAKNIPGPYQLQAAIAGCHASAPQAEMTDWPLIAKLYDQLLEMTGSPVVELNRAVAVAMADGPAVGLALVNELEASGALPQYYLLAATRADLLRRLGRRAEAAAAYREALALVATGPERRFLAARLTEVTR
jgi:RNA polymerase sigma-70 factor (ECF subfamily)